MDDFNRVGFRPIGSGVATEQASMEQGLREAARRLIEYNREADPGIRASYLFPSNQEIRLIHLDDNSLATGAEEGITPFYFGSSPADGIPFPSAIALIRPEEKERLSPPEEWGEWDQAEWFPGRVA